MEEILRLISMIIIGGFIGYLTNKIAVKMLFRPIQPKRVLMFRFQGLLPKRKSTIAKSMGRVIEQEFLTKDDIVETFLNEETKSSFKALLKVRLTEKINALIPPMFKSMLGSNLDSMIKNFIEKDGEELIHEVFDHLRNHGIEKLDIPALVEEKVDAMDIIEFEKLVYDIVDKELKHIEIVGLFLGMFIGLAQYFIINVIQ
ncbi:MAG: DUF445 domain-containing protein [Candidatus Izemoplasmataceae bacterium]